MVRALVALEHYTRALTVADRGRSRALTDLLGGEPADNVTNCA